MRENADCVIDDSLLKAEVPVEAVEFISARIVFSDFPAFVIFDSVFVALALIVLNACEPTDPRLEVVRLVVVIVFCSCFVLFFAFCMLVEALFMLDCSAFPVDWLDFVKFLICDSVCFTDPVTLFITFDA